MWQALDDELVRCDVDGKRGWWLERDRDAWSGADEQGPIRLLPPSDPFLLGDRTVLVPDRARRSAVWRAIGAPGILLRGPEVCGTWRQRVEGQAVQVTVTAWARLRPAERDAVAGEADAVAAVRGSGPARLQLDRD